MDLVPAELISQAEKITGLSDWGSARIDEPLQRFWQALHHEASLTPAGTQVFQQESVRLLSNRLLLEAEFARLLPGSLVPLTKPLFAAPLCCTICWPRTLPHAGCTWPKHFIRCQPRPPRTGPPTPVWNRPAP